MELPEKIVNISDFFEKFPGVGAKTAIRYALGLADWSKDDVQGFSQAIREIKNLRKCSECGFFAEDVFCDNCLLEDDGREGVLCVVESIVDCLAINRSRQYQGYYHVLGGTLNPLLNMGPEQLNLQNLSGRIVKRKIHNVIMALNPSVEGDATCAYIRELLPDGVKVDRIGFGIPIGGSLEYLDPMTISKALENRQEM